ncbi:flocculation protein FLO11-like [Cucumis melo var. makuwa]|uniref:Flocculation protein FLO11-like n=1 Tax=Cucumis melo var. makuwa TaxID=1194695 RepID=A0A5A7UQQ9_CUCMM|nr:flocculation protein FLO11-like [Cucumis melo var. makuwa]
MIATRLNGSSEVLFVCPDSASSSSSQGLKMIPHHQRGCGVCSLNDPLVPVFDVFKKSPTEDFAQGLRSIVLILSCLMLTLDHVAIAHMVYRTVGFLLPPIVALRLIHVSLLIPRRYNASTEKFFAPACDFAPPRVKPPHPSTLQGLKAAADQSSAALPPSPPKFSLPTATSSRELRSRAAQPTDCTLQPSPSRIESRRVLPAETPPSASRRRAPLKPSRQSRSVSRIAPRTPSIHPSPKTRASFTRNPTRSRLRPATRTTCPLSRAGFYFSSRADPPVLEPSVCSGPFAPILQGHKRCILDLGTLLLGKHIFWLLGLVEQISRSVSPRCSPGTPKTRFSFLQELMTSAQYKELGRYKLILNLLADFDDLSASEFKKVHVRNLCFNISPTFINQFLEVILPSDVFVSMPSLEMLASELNGGSVHVWFADD